MAKKRKRGRKKKKQSSISIWLLSLLAIFLVFYGIIVVLIEPNTKKIGNETSQTEIFIQRLAPHSQKIQRESGLLPSIILGQAILESNSGTSSLSAQYNNLFGIKAFGDEPKVILYTKEYVDDKWIEVPEPFRSYPTWEASMDDHVDLFKEGVNWNRDLYLKVLTADNYHEAAKELQTVGYATDPDYASKIIDVIETYELNRFD